MDNFQDLLFSLEDDSPASAYTEALAWKAVDAYHDGDNDNNGGDERFTEADLSPAAVMAHWPTTSGRHKKYPFTSNLRRNLRNATQSTECVSRM